MSRLTASPQPKSPSPHFIIESVTVTRRQTLFVQGNRFFARVERALSDAQFMAGQREGKRERDLEIRSISHKVLNLLVGRRNCAIVADSEKIHLRGPRGRQRDR
jgi:hypothetical protein